MANDHSKNDPSLTVARQDASAPRPLWQRVPRGWLILALAVMAWIAAYLIFQGVILLRG